MATDLDRFLDQRPVDLLVFGVPTHREPAFTRARDQIFKRLVARGFRAIAVDVDPAVARAVDDYVHGRSDAAPDGRNRSLAEWMRRYNDSAREPLSFGTTVENTGTMVVTHNGQLKPARDRVVIAGSLGSSAALGLGPPAAGTFEGDLCSRVGQGPLFTEKPRGVTRTDVPPQQDYLPLAADLPADAIWHVDLFPPAAAALADRIRQLPDVASQQSGPNLGVPDIAWDDWFFFKGEPGKHPFATIVSHDIPGFDDRSNLDRSGVYRLNVNLGRTEFRRLFGYGPEAFTKETVDFAAFDEFFPHPVYASQSWAGVVNPGPRSAEHVDRLLKHAHGRSRRGA